MNILLTGASGFVGNRYQKLSAYKESTKAVSLQSTKVDSITLNRIDVILQCAGIAHRMKKTDDQLYFDVNRDLTLELARKAKKDGVKHFIFLSTIKVYGKDFSDEPLTLNSPCEPTDPYGQSKWEAEEGLRNLEDNDFKVVILRPPLIYGPGAKGNLLRLMQMVAGNKPIPLGVINNKRSMVYVDNLVAYIDHLIQNNASGTFLPVDEPSISTTYLVEQLIKEINPSKKLFTLPGILKSGIKVLKPSFHKRLFGSLVVKSSYPLTNFHQPYSIEEGLSCMARAFKQ